MRFMDCLKQALAEQGSLDPDAFQAHIARIERLFEEQLNASGARDLPGADRSARERIVAEEALAVAERKKRRAKALALHAEYTARIDQARTGDPVTSAWLLDKKDKTGGVALARAAISFVDVDPRFPGTSFVSVQDAIRGLLYSRFGDTFADLNKGVFGHQKGKAHLPNAVRALYGEETGDAVAAKFATSFRSVGELAVDLFNAAGGSMRKLSDFRAPQPQNPALLIRAGEARWTAVHREVLDWDAMRYPDGSRIAAEDRDQVLKEAFLTLSTGGANKIDLTKPGGIARSAIGNALDQHRFLIYKDAESWLRVHDEFFDGSVFDVFTGYLDHMANKTAQVQVFGPNPEVGRQALWDLVRGKAAQLGGRAVAAAEAELKNTFDPMFKVATGQNGPSPDSLLANGVLTSAKLLISAQLGSAALLAIPGDFFQSALVRRLNKTGLFGGIGRYLKTFSPGKLGTSEQELARQSGFVMDTAVSNVVSASRFTGPETFGTRFGNRVSDAIMRASLLSAHTDAARWAAQAEFMGLLARSRGQAFDALPFAAVMRRYGIDANDWDAFRELPPHEPAPGVALLRPIDLLSRAGAEQLSRYYRWQSMLAEEAKKMVPESTLEGTTKLRDTTRADTLAGAAIYSAAMYKNFPISLIMVYGRLAMTLEGRLRRVGALAGLVAGMTLVGAIGVQLRELSKGRDPLPMESPSFLGKAMLSGGGLTLLGDFLFSHINERGFTPQQFVAGPIGGLAADTTQLAFGDVFKWADAMGSLGEKEFESTTAAKAVAFARKYTPGSTLWYARLVLQRAVFDRLEQLADPRAAIQQQRREQRRASRSGNESWWKPGNAVPERAPIH